MDFYRNNFTRDTRLREEMKFEMHTLNFPRIRGLTMSLIDDFEFRLAADMRIIPR